MTLKILDKKTAHLLQILHRLEINMSEVID